MIFKPGAEVRLIQPVIQGKVMAAVFNVDMEVELLVEYVDPDGSVHSRYFSPQQLEAVSAQE